MNPEPDPGTDSAWALRTGLALAGLEPQQLWLAYVGVGGMMAETELVAALRGTAGVSDREHDMLALTLNDSLLERGIHFPVAYSGELVHQG
ncbi:hypothetical protein GCM10027047_06060 [Rhodococcus aerolatus]